MRPHLRSAGLLVVPLRIGGGSRLKILEALASGLPVVSTSIGLEGLDLTNSEHVNTLDSWDDFARFIANVPCDYPGLLEQVERGREKVLRAYSWDLLASRFVEAWSETAAVTFPLQIRRVPVLVRDVE